MSEYQYHYAAAEDLLQDVDGFPPSQQALLAAIAHALLANSAANRDQAEGDIRSATAGERLAGCVSEANRLQVAGRPV